MLARIFARKTTKFYNSTTTRRYSSRDICLEIFGLCSPLNFQLVRFSLKNFGPDLLSDVVCKIHALTLLTLVGGYLSFSSGEFVVLLLVSLFLLKIFILLLLLSMLVEPDEDDDPKPPYIG
jgi:hypothetical protein